MALDWNKFRRQDGTIELNAVLVSEYPGSLNGRAFTYLAHVEEMQPINSRQAAAMIIATAIHIGTYDN